MIKFIINPKITTFFLIPIVLLLFGFSILKLGITIDKVSFLNIEISRLSILLNKKLDITIDKLKIKNSKNDDIKITLKKIDKLIKTTKYLLNNFISSIKIKSLFINNKKLFINITNNTIIVKTDDLSLDISFFYKNYILDFDINKNTKYKSNIHLCGNTKLDLKNKNLSSKIDINIENMILTADINATQKNIKIDFKSNDFDSIKFLHKYIELVPVLKEWLIVRIKAKKFKINNSSFIYNLDKKKIDLNSININAVLSNATIRFNNKVSAAKIEKIFIKAINDKISITAKKPFYKNKKVITKVDIKDIYSNPKTSVNLKIDSLFDDIVKNLLFDGYSIYVPIRQIIGTNNTDVKIDIDNKVDLYTNTDFYNSSFDLYGFLLQNGHGKVKFFKNRVYIDVYNIFYKDIINANYKATFDVDKSLLSSSLMLKKVFEKNLIDIKNHNVDFTIELKDDIKILVPDFALKSTINKHLTTLSIYKLEKLIKYFPIIYKYIGDGSLKLTTTNNVDYRLNIRLKLVKNLLIKNNSYLKQLYFISDIRPNSIILNDIKNEIYIKKEKNKIYGEIDNISFDVNYTDIIKDHRIIKNLIKNKALKNSAISANLLFTNSTIKTNKFKIKTDYLQILSDTNNTQISASYKDISSHALIKNQTINFSIKHLTGEYLNTLLDLNFSKGGLVDIFANGLLDDITITARIKNLQILNNNWVEMIKNGIINARFMDNILTIQQIVLDDVSMSLHGDGFINFNNNTLEITLYTSFQNLIKYIGTTDKIDKKTFKNNNNKLGFMIYISGDLYNPTIKIHKFMVGKHIDIVPSIVPIKLK